MGLVYEQRVFKIRTKNGKKYLFKTFKSEKCFKILEIREMPMKTTLRFHIVPVRIAKDQ